MKKEKEDHEHTMTVSAFKEEVRNLLPDTATAEVRTAH